MTPPNPGEGYRLLNGNEILQEGDEYWFPLLRYWNPTTLRYSKVAEHGMMVFHYRRKLEADNGRASGTN